MPRTEKTTATPTTLPPGVKALVGITDGDQGAPTLTIEELAAEQELHEPDGPVLAPPAEVAATAAGDQGITAWHQGVKITGLWINASQRNAYAAVAGVGWRRVVAVNDSSFLNITAMLAHARQMNVSCNVRIEADNLIHEVYVW